MSSTTARATRTWPPGREPWPPGSRYCARARGSRGATRHPLAPSASRSGGRRQPTQELAHLGGGYGVAVRIGQAVAEPIRPLLEPARELLVLPPAERPEPRVPALEVRIVDAAPRGERRSGWNEAQALLDARDDPLGIGHEVLVAHEHQPADAGSIVEEDLVADQPVLDQGLERCLAPFLGCVRDSDRMAHDHDKGGVVEQRLQETQLEQIRRGFLDQDALVEIPVFPPLGEQALAVGIGGERRVLGQMASLVETESAGPPVLPRDRIDALQELPLVRQGIRLAE